MVGVMADNQVVDLDSALLRAYVVTAEEMHFGRAAGRLQLTQQALSKRIARLEGLIAVRLFDRGSRRVELTAAGHRLPPLLARSWSPWMRWTPSGFRAIRSSSWTSWARI